MGCGFGAVIIVVWRIGVIEQALAMSSNAIKGQGLDYRTIHPSIRLSLLSKKD